MNTNPKTIHLTIDSQFIFNIVFFIRSINYGLAAFYNFSFIKSLIWIIQQTYNLSIKLSTVNDAFLKREKKETSKQPEEIKEIKRKKSPPEKIIIQRDAFTGSTTPRHYSFNGALYMDDLTTELAAPCKCCESASPVYKGTSIIPHFGLSTKYI